MAKFVLQGRADGLFWAEKSPPNAPLLWKEENGDEYYGVKKVYRLATIGVGSSIAYYLNAMWQVSTRWRYDHSTTVMFGQVDEWDARVRGDGFINHEQHNIGHWSALGAPRFSREYVERLDFASQNAFHFWRVCQEGGTHIPERVTSIQKKGDIFRLTTGSGDIVFAAKVICGSGAGPHYDLSAKDRGPRLPDELTPRERSEAYRKLHGRVVTLDEFMQSHPRQRGMENLRYQARSNGKKIIIHGANAGIDAVQRAWQYGYEVIFFTGESAPAWLKGNRLAVSPSATREGMPYVKIGRSRPPKLVPTEDGVRVSYQPEPPSGGSSSAVTVDVALYVIALGQDANAPGVISHVLTQGGIEAKHLEPIYDTNQIFGLPYQTILGFQTQGTRWSRGLQVIGAAATSLAAAWGTRIPHNYREQYRIPGDELRPDSIEEPRQRRALEQRQLHFRKAEQYLKEVKLAELLDHQIDPTKLPKGFMEAHGDSTSYLSTARKPAATAISSVLGAAQLGAIRAVTAAMHAMIPDYMLGNDSQANFTTDDRTMLAVYIAKNFPDIAPRDADDLVEQIIRARRTALNQPARFTRGEVYADDLGFTDAQRDTLIALLKDTNDLWKRIRLGK